MVNTISATDSLQLKIKQLEQLQKEQLADLKNSAVSLVGSFSPSQILRSTLQDITSSPDLKTAAINTAIGIGAGYLGKKLYVGNSKNIFKKVTGSAFQFLIANFVRNKIPEIKENNLHHQEI